MPKIYPYNNASNAAKELGKATGWRRIRRDNSNYLGNDPDMWIVNWGCRALPDHIKNCRVLNDGLGGGATATLRVRCILS